MVRGTIPRDAVAFATRVHAQIEEGRVALSIRQFSAVWMGGFACVAGGPFLLAFGAVDGTVGLVLTALVGAAMGALIQHRAIGCRSNLIYATFSGVLCAGLAMPLIVFFGSLLIAVFDDPTALLVAAEGLASFAVLGLVLFGWWIFPVGAVGGLTLHIAWKLYARRLDACR